MFNGTTIPNPQVADSSSARPTTQHPNSPQRLESPARLPNQFPSESAASASADHTQPTSRRNDMLHHRSTSAGGTSIGINPAAATRGHLQGSVHPARSPELCGREAPDADARVVDACASRGRNIGRVEAGDNFTGPGASLRGRRCIHAGQRHDRPGTEAVIAIDVAADQKSGFRPRPEATMRRSGPRGRHELGQDAAYPQGHEIRWP